MPVQSPPTKKSSIVHRSESLRSEVSDASQQSKRVSFNRDVHVKRIPRGSAVVDRNGKLVAVLDGALKNSESSTASPSGRLWVNSLATSKEALPEEDLLREAETILKHVDSVTCSTSAGHDTRSLERPSKTNGINGASSGVVGKSKPVIKTLQKSPSRLSDFFTRTLPSQIKSKSQSPPLTKSTQNLTSGTKDVALNGGSKPKENLKLRRSVSSDLSITNLNGSISKSEPNLYNGTRYKKVAKIKKPHGTRVALNSIGETPINSSSGSGSDKDSFPKKVSTSDSPVSSLSGPEEPSMANSLAQDYNNPRVSSIVQQLSNRRGQESPERTNPFANAPIVAPAGGNTHNNNQPFSYISGIKNSGNSTSTSSTERGRSPSKTTPTGKLLTSPKEVIYAQVVVSGKPGEPGVPGEKRTVHTTVMNGTPSRSSPQRTTYLNNSSNNKKPSNNNSELNDTSSPNSIQHFVYDKDSDKSRPGSKMNDHTSFRKGYPRSSTYDDFDFSSAKPRNNVTTVLLNNVDDDNLSFGSSRNNYYSGYRNQPSPTPSPNFRKPEQSFYFGNHKNDSHAISNNDFPSSYNYRSPLSNDYPSSREVSPVNKSFSSTYLVRDADRKKDSIVSSAKLVSAFGNNAHTGYDYMNNKLDNNRRESPRESPRRSPAKVSYNSGPDLPASTTRYGAESSRYDRSSYDKNNKKIKIVGSKTSTPNASNTSVNKVGLRSKENSPAPSPARDYRKSASPAKTTTLRREENSLERKYNKKNKDEQAATTATNTTTTTKTSTASNGGGLISTLMRRNKDKKAQKETKEKKEEKTELVTTEPDNVKENKIKRQRAKFLSAFLDKNFSKKNNPAPDANKPEGKNTKPTDSEIEEAERRRDGEYQSWSSGDDEYRFGHHRNGQLTRGKSYNFGDLNEESSSKPWYDQNDSDYRREMATSRYNSATLGRPGMRSSSHDSDMLRSKSLDRRAYRNRSPPRIIVTPNTPAVDETDKWKSTYDPIIRTFDRDRVSGNHHSTLSKKVSGLSKSSYDLDDHPDDRHHPTGGMNPSGKLRYFGDTDAEDLNYHNSNSYVGKNYSGNSNSNRSIPRTSSYLSRGKDNYSKYYTVPGSSLNSSGSENGSRMSKGSSNGGSQRSVYLHAPAVADIPPTGMQRRTLSRDELSNYSGPQKQTRHLARSMSVLAPWRPRHYREKYELNYNNTDTKENQPYGRPPKPPRSPTRKSMSPSPGRAGSTESLLKLSDEKKGKNTLRNSTLGRNKENVSVSRSKSMPKDTRFAGWLRRRRFGKEAKA